MANNSPTKNTHNFIRASIAALIGALLVVYIWQNWQVIVKSFSALVSASPWFFIVGALLTLLTYVFAAGSYYNLALKKLRLQELVVLEFASTAINRVFPSGLGGLGVHGVYLFKRGHTKTASALVVSTNTLLSFTAHNFLILLALLLAPQAVSEFHIPRINTLVIATFAFAMVAGVMFAVKRGAMSVVAKNVNKTLRAYKRTPSKLGFSWLCVLSVTITNFTIFMLACNALGISVPLVTGFLIYSIGLVVGAATPTPGGLAGVEAGLVAGLLAANGNQVSAIAAVLAFRFVTFWLPIIPGVFALLYVRKKQLL